MTLLIAVYLIRKGTEKTIAITLDIPKRQVQASHLGLDRLLFDFELVEVGEGGCAGGTRLDPGCGGDFEPPGAAGRLGLLFASGAAAETEGSCGGGGGQGKKEGGAGISPIGTGWAGGRVGR
jgi:hypothetical protein